jgi:hypothetical protein
MAIEVIGPVMPFSYEGIERKIRELLALLCLIACLNELTDNAET